jgi:transposase
MESMGRPRVYPDEFRERAVRLVREWRVERGVVDGGVTAISQQLGLHRETLRRWVIEEDVEGGDRRGVTRSERQRIVELERENRELRRANEILKAASAEVKSSVLSAGVGAR